MERLLREQFIEEEKSSSTDPAALLNLHPLLGFYVLSGEDCTSVFKRKGKVGPLKKLYMNPRFHQLGDDWNVKPEVTRKLEQ